MFRSVTGNIHVSTILLQITRKAAGSHVTSIGVLAKISPSAVTVLGWLV